MLYIPFANDENVVGGPITFMRYLHNFLLLHDFSFANDFNDTQVTAIFFPIAFNVEILKVLKQRGCKIIQRLDGIYYPSKHGEQYVERNREIKEIYCNLADHVVFQSRYSQAQCTSQFGEPRAYSIIPNGVDKDLFKRNLSLELNPDGVVNFITTGNIRNVDMLEPIIQALDHMVSVGITLQLTIVGPVVTNALKYYLKRPYVRYVGKQSLDEVARYLQASTIFLYSHLNPPCPNSVLEAISVGLPVVGFDSGAMSELLFWQKDLLAAVSQDVFQLYQDFHFQALEEKILFCIQNWDFCKRRAMDHSHLYSFVECGEQYRQIFTKMI